jgi:hypothetical protein
MKRILFSALSLILLLSACIADPTEEHNNSDSKEKKDMDFKIGQCPYGHTDSIIPIIYGYPTEEDFQKSDSGLVALGGCLLPDMPQNQFCKIHQISF